MSNKAVLWLRLQTSWALDFPSGGLYIWNKLPMTLRQCETINSFKCKLKTYLFNQAYDDY